MKRRRDRKPFTLEEARKRLSDLLWQIGCMRSLKARASSRR